MITMQHCVQGAKSAGGAVFHANRRNPLEDLDSAAVITRWHRGQEICGQERGSDYWHRVLSGLARRCAVQPSGRRQIVELLLPGDFFGFTPEQHSYAVEAIAEGTMIAGYSRRRVEMLADSNPQVARAIREMACEAICRLEGQLLILGRMTALQKVGSFLIEMADRLTDGPADNVILPMSRYDIADFLAMSVETVSRSLTGLKNRGVIKLIGTRGVRIVNRDALEDGEEMSFRDRSRPQ
jgi:CRP-like cAMP-binding protein